MSVAFLLAVLVIWGAVSYVVGMGMALGRVPTLADLLRRRPPPNGRLASRYARGTHGREIPGGPPNTHAGTGTLTMDGELTACGAEGPIATVPAYVTCPRCRTILGDT